MTEKPSCYIYLPVPIRAARYRPDLPEDSSPPHVTLLYVGKINESAFNKVTTAVLHTVPGYLGYTPLVLSPGRSVEFFKVGTDFDVSGDGNVAVAYLPVKFTFFGNRYVPTSPQDLHDTLHRVIKNAGVEVKHISHNRYTPHLTLKYLKASDYTRGGLLRASVQRKINEIAAAVRESVREGWQCDPVFVDWGDRRVVVMTSSADAFQAKP